MDQNKDNIEDDFDYIKAMKDHAKVLEDIASASKESKENIEELEKELARKKEMLLSDHSNQLLAFANKGELSLVDNERFNFIFNAPVKIYIKDKCKCDKNNCNK